MGRLHRRICVMVPHEHREQGRQSVNSLVLSAAVHRLTGRAIGEMLGMILSIGRA